jgi:parallel beta-helix repeat protein
VVGEGPDVSIIDGGGGGIAVYVTASRVEVRDLGIRNASFGLWLFGSNNSRVVNNRLSMGSHGLRLLRSRSCLVVGNRVSGYSSFGVELDYSGNCTLKDNVLVDNRYNFGVDGRSLYDFVNDVDESNTVNGRSVRYLINQRDVVFDSYSFGGMGYFGVVNSSNIRVRDLDVQSNIQGVLLAFTPNSSISNVNARDNWNGIYVAYSSNVSVTDVKANGNFDYGIKFFNSSDARVFRNNVDNNGWSGIGLFTCHRSVVDLNEASFGKYDLHLVFTNNSVVTRNTALVRPGSYSIALYYSHSNLIYRNTFDSSLLFVETRNSTRFTPENAWDNGLEGNYWLSYGGFDSDMDGVGDSVYKVGEHNVDNCPLMGRFSEFTVNPNGEVFDVGVISNSTIAEFRLDVDDRRVSFSAAGQNGTLGFCRVAVPAGLLSDLDGRSLGFLVNGNEPVVVRQWSDDAYGYWYLSFANVPSRGVLDPLYDVAVFLTFLLLTVIALVVLWKRKPVRSETFL